MLTTAEPTDVGQIEQVDSLSDAVEVLRDLGYHARLTDDGVLGGISIREGEEESAESRDFMFMITEDGENFERSLQFNCQLCTIGDLPDNEMDTLPWIFLAVNTEIQPFSVGCHQADAADLDEKDVLVLTNSIPLGDLSRAEFQSAMDGLRRGLVAVIPSLIKQ